MKKLTTLILLLLSGCAQTNITSFTAPEFKGVDFSKFIVVTPNLNLAYSMLLQTKICDAIKNENKSCILGLDFFPPLKNYTNSDIKSGLVSNNINGYLIVRYGSSNSSSVNLGSITNTTANIFSDTVTAYSSTVPISAFSRSDGYSLTLIDVKSTNKVLVGEATTQAQGLANITDDVFTSSLAKKIIQKLKKEGLL